MRSLSFAVRVGGVVVVMTGTISVSKKGEGTAHGRRGGTSAKRVDKISAVWGEVAHNSIVGDRAANVLSVPAQVFTLKRVRRVMCIQSWPPIKTGRLGWSVSGAMPLANRRGSPVCGSGVGQ